MDKRTVGQMDRRTKGQKDRNEALNVKLLFSKSFLTASAATENYQSDYKQRPFYFLFPNFEVKFLLENREIILLNTKKRDYLSHLNIPDNECPNLEKQFLTFNRFC